MFEVRDLRLVRAIREHGSLARAARTLGVTQPALTRRLAALEARLRGPLFERNARGTIPTDLGRTILAEAEDILSRLDNLGRRAGDGRGDQVRDLNLVAGFFMAETLCVVAAARMLSLFPTVRVRLSSANWADVPRALHDRAATIGFFDLRGITDDPGLEIEPLRPQPALFVVRPGHPLVGRTDITLSDIMAFPMMLIGRQPAVVQTAMAEARSRARGAGGLHPAFPALVHESPTVALRALPHSDAITGLTFAVAGPALAAGEVAALRWRAPWVSVHPGIARLRHRALGEAEQAFLDLLRSVDRENEAATLAWFARNGLNAACD